MAIPSETKQKIDERKREYDSLKTSKESLLDIIFQAELPESVSNSNAIEGDINIATKKVLLKQKPTVAGAKLCPEGSIIVSRVRPNRGAVALYRGGNAGFVGFYNFKTTKRKVLTRISFLLFGVE